MNSNNLVIKQKQTNKQTYKKTESQNSIVRFFSIEFLVPCNGYQNCFDKFLTSSPVFN